ncbi:MAG: hypothetical protein WD342_05485 [Verrucomicrobiales bacterium]
MNKLQKYYRNFTTAAALGIFALFLAPAAMAQDEDVKVKVKDDKVKVKSDDGKVKIKKDGKVKVKGDAGAEEVAIARAALSAEEQAEFQASLKTGYVVPQERYIYLDPVPETRVALLPPAPEGTIYRYYGDTVYTINPETYAIIDVRTFE